MQIKPVKTIFVFTLAGMLLSGSLWAMTEEENQQLLEDTKNYKFKNVTTPEGLNFAIPEDMPIEKRNGVVAPIPFEEYSYFKFKKLEEKISALDKKIDESLKSIDKKLDDLHAALGAAQNAGLGKKNTP